MPRAPDLSGIALDGRYELHALIGEGTFGRVYRGRDRRLAREVAVKVIKPWWAEDPEWARSFEREAQLLASISDPGIIQIFDVGSAPEGLYYVAELVDGESLASRLRRGRVAAPEACRIAILLARALARAHSQRVVHRDVKPANVLITPDGQVKVGDFGVARLAEGSSEEALATVAGTPGYMAPEQARGDRTSPATDVYGVGVILYEMLAGRAPFEGSSAVELALHHLHDPPPALLPETPTVLAAVVERALVKDPADRFRDGHELEVALAQALRQLGDGERPATAGIKTSVYRRALRSQRRDPRLAPTRVGDPRSPRRNFHPAERRQRVALLVLVLMLALGMGAAALATAPGHLRVPNLRGISKNRILIIAHRADFHPSFSGRFGNEPRGTAIRQIPEPGTRVREGSTVRVVLSAGPPPVKVPQLVGSSAAQAQALLMRLKLRAHVIQVPAPGISPGTVTRQSPAPAASVPPGSTVSLSDAEIPRPRLLTTISGDGAGRSVPFRIRGRRWQIVYSMGYEGTCTFIFICSGPSAKVVNVGNGSTVDGFDLGEGSAAKRTFSPGPGVYQISVSPGSDTARWNVAVEDLY
jgi:eukaryotic-like serine/threonine-protein kinase